MIGIGKININGEGKSKEDIKKEAMEAFEKQVDEMLSQRKEETKEDNKSERKPSKISMKIAEDEGMTGYGIETDVEINGLEYSEQMTMLTSGVAQLFKQLFEDKSDGVLAVSQFSVALLHQYLEDEEDEK